MTPTAGIAAVIQLAVAPVFLLAAIAGLLGVMSTRLGRIIGRLHAGRGKLFRGVPLDGCASRVEKTGSREEPIRVAFH